jgi:hypothetical protein
MIDHEAWSEQCNHDVEEYTTWKWITETHRPVPYEIPHEPTHRLPD